MKRKSRTIPTIHFENWHDTLVDSIKQAKNIRIISPFLGSIALESLGHRPQNSRIHLITRYELGNFLKGVSSLDTVKELIKIGVKIRGVQGIHSKIYIFDDKEAVITSANFTSGGLKNNYECGIITHNQLKIASLLEHFDFLWEKGQKDLENIEITDWENIINTAKKQTAKPAPDLPDMGVRIPKANGRYHKVKLSDPAFGAYLKFWGKSSSRAERNETIKQILHWTEAHYAVTFPEGERPREIMDDDTVYMAYIVKDHPGYMIFGRGYGTAHVPGRDDASHTEKSRKPWKKDYPHYIRITSPVFIDAKLSDCPELGHLIDTHDVNVFYRTQARAAAGEKDIKVKNSLKRKPGIRLSAIATVELDRQFSKALEQHGKIPDAFLSTLPPETGWSR